jgi:hypothetical protein
VFRIFDSRHDFVLHSGWKMAIMYESNLDFDKLVIESLVALNLSKDLDGLHRETEDFCHSKIMVNIRKRLDGLYRYVVFYPPTLVSIFLSRG